MNRALPPHLRIAQCKAAVPINIEPAIETIADDVLYGAEAIRKFLGLKNTKQVYYMFDRGNSPIGKVPGLGLTASKKALLEWYGKYVPGFAA